MLPRLIAISDLETVGAGVTLDRARRLCSGSRPGSVLIQLRDRQLPVRELLDVGHELRKICTDFEQGLAVNDRLDLAMLLGADAVHLGEQSVPIADARRLLPGRPVYVAAHDEGAAAGSSADAVVLAPVVEPRKGAPALGLRALERLRAALAARSAPPRLYALGGVTPDCAAACLSAGADGVAAQGWIWSSKEPLRLSEALGIDR